MRIADCGLRNYCGLLIGALLAWCPIASTAETIDRVLAVVAGQIITLSDVNAARALGLQSPGDAGDPVRVVLSKLVDRELVLAEVERYAPPSRRRTPSTVRSARSTGAFRGRA
jgi:hypothetical protein